jgi:hypothetical protein
MRATADHLRQTAETAVPLLHALTPAQACANPYPPKWSKAEILGHLIDSACNNHQKFVRVMAQPHLVFPGYAQNHWTAVQHYNDADWSLLVNLFHLYNTHLADVIEHADPATLNNTITVEGAQGPAGPFTLRFIMADYIEHMKHHLRQIFPGGPFTDAFKNVYGA